jgi:hypothetical protein
MSRTASRADARQAVQTALDTVADRAREVGKQTAAEAVSVRNVAAARGRAARRQARAELEQAAKSARAGAKAAKRQASAAGRKADRKAPRTKRGKKKALFGLLLLGGAVVAVRKFLSESAPAESGPVPPRTIRPE